MSFWTTLEHDLVIVGKDALAVAPLAGAIVGVVNPAAGALITGIAGRITASMISVEKTITDAKSGELKAGIVKADFDNALALAGEITGKQYTYDQAAMQSAMDAQTAAFNGFAALKASIKTI